MVHLFKRKLVTVHESEVSDLNVRETEHLTIDLINHLQLNEQDLHHIASSELPSTYHPCGLLEVGASRVILSHDRKLTELTLLFREFVFSC